MACQDTTDNCGCLYPSNTDCVFIKNIDSNCLSISDGDTLTSAVNSILENLCNLNPSGYLITVVDEGTGITVTSSTTGNTTTYTVNVSQEVLDQINTIETNVTQALDCNTQQVYDIVSTDNSVIVEVDSSDSCGRILNLSVLSPSGTFYKGGIIYNNVEKSATSGSNTQQTLKSFKISDNFDTTTLVNGDEIRFRATGQIKGDGTIADLLIIELYDGATLDSETFGGFSAPTDALSSFILNGVLTVSNYETGEGLLTISVERSSIQNGTVGNNIRDLILVDKEVTSIDWNNLEIHVDFDHQSSSSGTYNFARQLMVEIVKTI